MPTEEEPPFSLDELPDKEEYLNAKRKIEFLASRHGQGYEFSPGSYHDPENGVSNHDMWSPEGAFAGEIQHYSDGTIGHLYVHRTHRAALPKLLMHATEYAQSRGWAPPHDGGVMSPVAYRMASRLAPNTTKLTGGNPKGDVIDRYEN